MSGGCRPEQDEPAPREIVVSLVVAQLPDKGLGVRGRSLIRYPEYAVQEHNSIAKAIGLLDLKNTLLLESVEEEVGGARKVLRPGHPKIWQAMRP